MGLEDKPAALVRREFFRSRFHDAGPIGFDSMSSISVFGGSLFSSPTPENRKDRADFNDKDKSCLRKFLFLVKMNAAWNYWLVVFQHYCFVLAALNLPRNPRRSCSR